MKKPIVLVIMDGVGRGDGGPGDAVKQANTPTLDNLMATCPMTWLKAHGTAVGLPTDDDMGNSEVGHNALGCGQIYSQGAKLVGESIENGTLYASETWKDLIANAVSGKALHFLGLLSDGNVHSNIHHLIAMLREAHAEGVKKAYCHILLDGRDVPATSALEYVDMLEKVLAELNTEGCDYAIASGGEISRVMLAIKVALGAKDGTETLVFDEVDAGVGGSTANALATVLAELADSHQVIAITHLAQVAVLADAHYTVTKTAGDTPETILTPVKGDERVAEVARLLSGTATETSLAHARELLRQ